MFKLVKIIFAAMLITWCLSTATAQANNTSRLTILGVNVGMTPDEVRAIFIRRGLQEMPTNDYILSSTGETQLGLKKFMPPFNKPTADGSRNIMTAQYSSPPTDPKLMKLQRDFTIGSLLIPYDQLKAKLIQEYGQPTKTNELRSAVVLTWYHGNNVDFCITQNAESADPDKCKGIMMEQNIGIYESASGMLVSRLTAKLFDLSEYRVDRKRFEQYAQASKDALLKKQMEKSTLPDF